MKLPEEFSVSCETPIERTLVLDKLLSLGYRWHDDEWYTTNRIDDAYPQSQWPTVTITQGKLMHGTRRFGYSYGEFWALATGDKSKMLLW